MRENDCRLSRIQAGQIVVQPAEGSFLNLRFFVALSFRCIHPNELPSLVSEIVIQSQPEGTRVISLPALISFVRIIVIPDHRINRNAEATENFLYRFQMRSLSLLRQVAGM